MPFQNLGSRASAAVHNAQPSFLEYDSSGLLPQEAPAIIAESIKFPFPCVVLLDLLFSLTKV